MSEIAYTVVATMPDEQTGREYVAWLRDGHVDGVLQGGASAGLIVQIDDPAAPIRIETRYRFASMAAFDRYEAEAAPALRADGLARWPGRGVTFERTIGRIVV